MLDWLLTPIDPSRVHEVSVSLSWHGRIMLLAWGILSPTAILIARFGKILPNQKWPEELDSRTWWNSHWLTQTLVLMLSLFALGLIMSSPAVEKQGATLHAIMGYLVVGFGLLQGLSGVFRGSKGGPTAPNRDGSLSGDHYDMTKRRLMFEALHKTVGYLILALVAVTIPSGMWAANAPKWMFFVVFGWWCVLFCGFIFLQSRGLAVETYQAIWGPDKEHPGNNQPPRGLGVRRPSQSMMKDAGE